MRRVTVVLLALGVLAGAAHAAAPVRGTAFCWDFDQLGTDGPDRVEGTAGAEHVATFAGDDEIHLHGGDDCASTGLGDDVVHLGPGDDAADTRAGDDRIFGGPGDDVLLPGPGADLVDGGEGDDLIRDDRGDADPDILIGGPGHDVLRAANAGPDLLDCGPGWDVVIADPTDTLRDCEDVRIARRPALTARAVRTGVRPEFSLRWRASEPAPGSRVAIALLTSPAPRPGCTARAWRTVAAGGDRLRLRRRGPASACPGLYRFAATPVDDRPGGRRVACDALAGAPLGGCAPTEALGVVALRVR